MECTLKMAHFKCKNYKATIILVEKGMGHYFPVYIMMTILYTLFLSIFTATHKEDAITYPILRMRKLMAAYCLNVHIT